MEVRLLELVRPSARHRAFGRDRGNWGPFVLPQADLVSAGGGLPCPSGSLGWSAVKEHRSPRTIKLHDELVEHIGASKQDWDILFLGPRDSANELDRADPYGGLL